MRIGELADQVGVNPKTVRYYEQIGLIPRASRTSGGYREYTGVELLAVAAQRLGHRQHGSDHQPARAGQHMRQPVLSTRRQPVLLPDDGPADLPVLAYDSLRWDGGPVPPEAGWSTPRHGLPAGRSAAALRRASAHREPSARAAQHRCPGLGHRAKRTDEGVDRTRQRPTSGPGGPATNDVVPDGRPLR